MGYIKHKSIIVTGWDDDNMKAARQIAVDIFDRNVVDQNGGVSGGSLIGEIVKGLDGGFISFFIAPDGSKESFDLSAQCDDARTEFLDWLDANANCDYIEVFFGGDNSATSVLRKSKNVFDED